MEGLDYSWDRPDLAAAKAAGVGFVMRYLEAGRGGRPDLTQDEVRQIHAAGLALGLIWEESPGAALGSTAGGISSAQRAIAQAKALGAPAGVAIYYTVDFDLQPSQMDAARQYFRGVKSVGGPYRIGVYGGLRAIQAVYGSGHADYAWQTLAWSGGVWDSRCHLHQYTNNVPAFGANVDNNRSLARSWGQWSKTTKPVHPAPGDLLAWCAANPEKLRAILKEYL